MFSDDELTKLKRTGESERVEFKPSLAQASGIRRAICAFANDLPGDGRSGVILIGLNSDGSCAGLQPSDQDQQKLANWAFGGDILPHPDTEIAVRHVDGCDVIAVEVRPSGEPPVRYQGQVWVRIGSTNRRATPEQEQRLVERRRSHDLPFDQQPVEGLELSDRELDLAYFRREYLPNAVAPEVLEENARSLEQQMAALRLLTRGHPTYGALLVLAYEPRAHVPGAYLQFLRIDGSELADPIQDQKELSGNLPLIMDRLDALFEANIKVAVEVAGA